MLLTLCINHLNPHQETLLVGLIMKKDLALNPMVNYRINYLTKKITLSMEARCLDRCRKIVNISSFYDNGGGYSHQSNYTVRGFHLNLPNSKLKNATTTTPHIYTLLARMFEKN